MTENVLSVVSCGRWRRVRFRIRRWIRGRRRIAGGPCGVGVPVGEEEGPAVLLGFGGEEVDGLFPGVEGEVVEAGGAAVVVVGGEGGGLFEDEVGVVEPPAASVVPGLVGGVAECFEEPLPVGDGAVEVGDPDFDVVEGAGCRQALGGHGRVFSLVKGAAAYPVVGCFGPACVLRHVPFGHGQLTVRVGWGVCGEAGVGVVRARSSGPGRGVRRCW